jgi:thioesterase domain-containing protein
MASRYLAELQSHLPRGPYVLGGWSMGGVIAFEMAQQLRAQGQAIALLAMFDSEIPRPLPVLPKVLPSRFLAEFAHQCGLDLCRKDFDNLASHQQLPFLLDQAKAANVVPADLEFAAFRRLYLQRFRIFRNNVRALRRYVPEPFPGRVVLIQAADRSETAPPGPKWNWQDLASDLDVHVVPGNHFSIIREPHVQHLAARLADNLQLVEGVCEGCLR